MVPSSTAASLFITTVSLILALSYCAEKIPHCGESLWDITHGVDAEEGQADLVITIPNITDTLSSVSCILNCDDLVVNGTGKTTLIPNEGQNTTVYHVSVPEANDVKEWEAQGQWQAHSCIIQFTYHSTDSEDSTSDDTEAAESDESRAEGADDIDGSTDEIECHLTLLTVLGRILPRCNLKSAKPLLKEVEVDKKLGQVLLQFHNSGNDVFTHDSKCEVDDLVEHNHANALQDNMIPLAPPGADSAVIDIDFYPDCDNETVLNMYRDREMSECHMEIYQVCQEGHQLVKKIELDFEEGALRCESPKSSFDELLESLELTFFIESRPVVALLFLLVCNGVLYLLLVPIVVCKMVSGKCRGKNITAEEKEPLLAHQQSPPESPAHPHMSPSHPHMSPPHPQTSPSHPHMSPPHPDTLTSHPHMSPPHPHTSAPHPHTSPQTPQ